jgi:hypothetical protein
MGHQGRGQRLSVGPSIRKVDDLARALGVQAGVLGEQGRNDRRVDDGAAGVSPRGAHPRQRLRLRRLDRASDEVSAAQRHRRVIAAACLLEYDLYPDASG